MIFGMTVGIDHKSEPTAPGIFVARHKEATFIIPGLSVTRPSITGDDRHDLSHSGVLIGEDCRGGDVVCGMALIKRAAILRPALTLGERATVDLLPDVGPGIADGLFCH